MDSLNKNWSNEDGTHEGGVSCGVGYCISWQRGPLGDDGRNGAFLLEVLGSCRSQLAYFQDSKFKSQENEDALSHLDATIVALESRRDRRSAEGTLGTTMI